MWPHAPSKWVVSKNFARSECKNLKIYSSFFNCTYIVKKQTKLAFLFPDPGWTLCPPVLRLPAAGLTGAVGFPAGRASWRSEPCQEEALPGPEGCRGPSRWGIAHTWEWRDAVFCGIVISGAFYLFLINIYVIIIYSTYSLLCCFWFMKLKWAYIFRRLTELQCLLVSDRAGYCWEPHDSIRFWFCRSRFDSISIRFNIDINASISIQ